MKEVRRTTPTSGSKKLTFAYDYLGRRVEKIVYNYSGGQWNETSHLRFVYDGRNVVLVLDGNESNATVQKYTWGLDLSGQAGNPPTCP